MDPLTYNVPAARVTAYRGRRLVIRSHDPGEIVACLSKEEMENLAYVQLLSPDADVDDLIAWGENVPIDVVLRDPATEFPLLYRFARLLENHPVRVSIPVVAGFSKAVKLAVSLNLAVKLEMVRQPDLDRVEELTAVLDLYLHRTTVSQPVEWFHSLFLSFYSGQPTTLWSVQEEDPAQARYITEEGEETISSRFAGIQLPGTPCAFVAEHQRELLAENRECARCEFFEPCGGYFKWPDREYSCDGVRSLFRTLRDASVELQQDVDAALEAQGGKQQ
jgi:hypothetical protein